MTTELEKAAREYAEGVAQDFKGRLPEELHLRIEQIEEIRGAFLAGWRAAIAAAHRFDLCTSDSPDYRKHIVLIADLEKLAE